MNARRQWVGRIVGLLFAVMAFNGCAEYAYVNPDRSLIAYDKTAVSKDEYVAFSLRSAQQQIEAAGQTDWRKAQPLTYTLGGISKIRGLVYDPKGDDVILVGHRDPSRPTLTLDDLVVALRARFIHNQWPVVSIDPTKDEKMQHVRYEGGIEDTAFGMDMFDADLRLKKISHGSLPSGVPGLQSVWELSEERIDRSGEGRTFQVNARSWFYPVAPPVTVRESVAAIEELNMGVFTEVMSASFDGVQVPDVKTYHDPDNELFAKQMQDHYAEVARSHPSIACLPGLNEMVALTRAIEEMDPRPDLTYWLKVYVPKPIRTPKQQRVLRQQSTHFLGRMYIVHTLSGGVKLAAVALRLQAGDVSALREAVVATRPTLKTLVWTFKVDQWVIATSPEAVRIRAQLGSLLAQADTLATNRRYDDMIKVYDRILEISPDLAEAYGNRAACHAIRRNYDLALTDYTRALGLNPSYAQAYFGRGNIYISRNDYQSALSDFDKVLSINPNVAEAYHNRGICYFNNGEPERALADYEKSIGLNPRNPNVYCSRGNYFLQKGDYDRAVVDYTRTLALDPGFVSAYIGRGNAYIRKKDESRARADYNKAAALSPESADAHVNLAANWYAEKDYERTITECDRALALDPKYAQAYFSRGCAYGAKGDQYRAIADYDKAILYNPNYYEAYNNRGNIYCAKGDYDRAIADYNKSLSINPKSAYAYGGRGNYYMQKRNYDLAIADYDRAIALDGLSVVFYTDRARAHYAKRDYDDVIADCGKAIALNGKSFEAYNSRAGALYNKGDYVRAWADIRSCQEAGGTPDPKLVDLLSKTRAKAGQAEPTTVPASRPGNAAVVERSTPT